MAGGYGDGLYGDGTYGDPLGGVPATQTPSVRRPVERTPRPLGCARYEAHLRTRGGGTFLLDLPLVGVQWGRVLDDTSQAIVQLGDKCADALALATPWLHELALFLDGHHIWAGPIYQNPGDRSNPSLTARDLTAWWDRRFIHNDHDWSARSGVTVTETTQGGAGANEMQAVAVSAAAGTYTLSIGPATTGPLALTATAAAIQTALEALSSVGAGNVAVTGSDGGPYIVTFQGSLSGQPVQLIAADNTQLNLGTEDTATIFRVLSDDAMSVDNSPGIHVVTTPTGVKGTTVVKANSYTKAAQVLRDLAGSSIDFTAVARQILAGGLVVPAKPIGTITDAMCAAPPPVMRDGSVQANKWAVTGLSTDAAGNPIAGVATDADFGDTDGVLEDSASSSVASSLAACEAEARGKLALRGRPVVVDRLVLHPDAPIDIEKLIPGALCHLALNETVVPVNDTFRLQSVDAAATGDQFAITLTFQPAGGS